jgi:thymidylate kinase
MIVIIEGVDKTGKTSIAKALSEKIGLTNFRLYQKHTLDFNESNKWPWYVGGMNIALMNVCKAFDNFILDRFHYSEYVYSKSLLRNTIIPFEVMDNFLNEISTPVITFLLDTNWETYMSRCGDETKRFSKEEFDTQRMFFNAAHANTKLKNKFKIHTSDTSVVEVVNLMDDTINEYDRRLRTGDGE